MVYSLSLFSLFVVSLTNLSFSILFRISRYSIQPSHNHSSFFFDLCSLYLDSLLLACSHVLCSLVSPRTIPFLAYVQVYFCGKSMIFSSDTYYDPPVLKEMYEKGVFHKARYEFLSNYQWFHTLIFHEVCTTHVLRLWCIFFVWSECVCVLCGPLHMLLSSWRTCSPLGDWMCLVRIVCVHAFFFRFLSSFLLTFFLLCCVGRCSTHPHTDQSVGSSP
jgi:hypothetical protein